MYISHITLTTGHVARTSRADVHPNATSLLAGWLLEIVNSGGTHPLPVDELSHYSAQALVDDGGLVVTVFTPLGVHIKGKPHEGEMTPLITMGVAQRSRQSEPLWQTLTRAFPAHPDLSMPQAPWCAVALHPALAMDKDAAEWLGDFERSLAWAWLTRNPGLQAV